MRGEAAIVGQSGTAGFTLVELLVSLAIMSLITSFAIMGLNLSNKAWVISRTADEQSKIDNALERLIDLISQSKPVDALDEDRGIASLKFRGDAKSISFVTLSEGYALRGGLIDVLLVWDQPGSTSRASEGEGGTISLRTAIFRPNLGTQWSEPAILLQDVTNVSIGYFGAAEVGQGFSWYPAWIHRDRLPALIALDLRIRVLGKTRHVKLEIPLRHVSQ